MISFNVPPVVGGEEIFIADAIKSHKICGDGKYTKLCNQWLEEKTGTKKLPEEKTKEKEKAPIKKKTVVRKKKIEK